MLWTFFYEPCRLGATLGLDSDFLSQDAQRFCSGIAFAYVFLRRI